MMMTMMMHKLQFWIHSLLIMSVNCYLQIRVECLRHASGTVLIAVCRLEAEYRDDVAAVIADIV